MRNTELAPVNFFTYIAKTKPNEVDALLKKAGYKKKPINLKTRSAMLAHYISQDKESALVEVAKFHPDRELILKDIEVNADGGKCEPCEEKQPKNDLKTEMELQAAGTFIPSADGDSAPVKKGLSDKTVNLLIISGSVIFITAIMSVAISSIRKQ